MNKLIFFLALCMCQFSFAAEDKKEIDHNTYKFNNSVNIKKIKLGMTHLEVEEIMGTNFTIAKKKISGEEFKKENPFSKSSKGTIRIWVYVTSVDANLNSTVHWAHESTPVLFQDSRVFGIGQDAYAEVVKPNNRFKPVVRSRSIIETGKTNMKRGDSNETQPQK